MDFIDYMWWKLGALAVAAFAYNFWRAATGRKGQEDPQEPHDT